LNELKAMMNFSNGIALENEKKTRYMEIEHREQGNEFKNRPVLGRPSSLCRPVKVHARR